MLYVVVVQLAPTLLVTVGLIEDLFFPRRWVCQIRRKQLESIGRVGDSPYAGTKATYARGRSTPSKSSLRFDWEAPSNTLLGFTPTHADVSPLESMRSTTKLLQDFNEKNAPQDFMDAETLVSNIEELTTDLNHCSLGCTSPVAPGETTNSSYFQSNRPEVETAPSVCAHGFKRGKPDSTKATPHAPEEPINSSSSQSNRPEQHCSATMVSGVVSRISQSTVHTVSDERYPKQYRRTFALTDSGGPQWSMVHGKAALSNPQHWMFALTA
ncbi:hypothetical protein B0H13DRAFT_2350656 [Mycena leptocephala]|nr:hypothetical protein B0H13DRAFT_2350656 [Mycena leptocephala]